VGSCDSSLAGLKSADAVQRLRSAWQLGELHPAAKEAIPPLREAVRDEDADVRGSAAEALGKIGAVHREAVAALIPLLEAVDSTDFRARVAYALGRAGPNSVEAIPSLVALVEDRDAHASWAALLALGEIGPQSPRVLPALTFATKDPAAAQRFVAAWALGHIGGQASAAAPALEQLQEDLQPLVAETALWALSEIEPRRFAFGPPRAARPQEPRPQVLESVRSGISSADRASRLGALWGAGELGPAAAALIPELIPFLRGPDPELQGAAAESLGKIGWGSPGAVDALAQELGNERSFVRAQIAYAIGWMGPAAGRAVPALVRFCRELEGFTHKQIEARWAAACALGLLRLPVDGLVEEFVRLLADPESDVRFMAAESLGYQGPRAASAAAALQTAAGDPHFTVRSRARWALDKIRGTTGEVPG
jgi:HEAT repeat protein